MLLKHQDPQAGAVLHGGTPMLYCAMDRLCPRSRSLFCARIRPSYIVRWEYVLTNSAPSWPLVGTVLCWPRSNGSAPTKSRVAAAHRRLARSLEQAPVIPIDDNSRMVFFSDLHRGDGGPSDAFRHNEALYLQALEQYHRRGYTYIEVGDGDELWKNPGLTHLRRAHAPVYRVLDRYRHTGRLHLLIGNHQMVGDERPRRDERDDLLGGEALLLEHGGTGQRILVTHGHQGDGAHAHLYGALRWLVRHFWRRLQDRGMRTALPEPETQHQEKCWVRWAAAWSRRNQSGIEGRIKSWLASVPGLAVICGHTHRAAFANPGEQPYFNCGSGVQPGRITGLEIAGGEIRLVTWADRPKEGPGAQSLPAGRAYRHVVEGPRRIGELG